MIKLLKFYQELRSGSSLPLIVGGSDGIKYVVKARGSGDGILANVVEWLSSKLGQLIQIPILQPELLTIDTSFVEEAQDPEIRELLARSVGINFGTKYLEDTSVFNQQHVLSIDNTLKTNIFLYDLFLLNIDRSSKNTNMIFNNNQLCCLDYSSSITMRNLVNRKNYQSEAALLKEIKKHPFYSDNINANDFIHQFKDVTHRSICDLVNTLPEAWLRQLNVGEETETRKIISERLIAQKNNVDLQKRFFTLKMLEMETEKARRLRVLKNKNSFKEKFGIR